MMLVCITTRAWCWLIFSLWSTAGVVNSSGPMGWMSDVRPVYTPQPHVESSTLGSCSRIHSAGGRCARVAETDSTCSTVQQGSCKS